MVHAPLEAAVGGKCEKYADALTKCHTDNYASKFLGACNLPEKELVECFRVGKKEKVADVVSKKSKEEKREAREQAALAAEMERRKKLEAAAEAAILKELLSSK